MGGGKYVNVNDYVLKSTQSCQISQVRLYG